LPPSSYSPGISASFRDHSFAAVPRYWFAVPLCRSPFLPAMWFSCGGVYWARLSVQRISRELHLPTEQIRPNLAGRPQSGQLLSWTLLPYSAQGLEGPLHAGLPARYVPSSGFAYPLDGLRPSSPCRFCFAPAALLGFALRSLLLPQGTNRVSAAVNPRAVSLAVSPTADAVGRPGEPRLLGFHPCRSPLRPNVRLTRRPPDAPLGFTLLGPTNTSLDRLSPAFLSRAFPALLSACSRRLRVLEAHIWSAARRQAAGKRTALIGFPHQYVPNIRTVARPAYGFSSRRAAHCCRLTGDLKTGQLLYRSCRGRLRCRSVSLTRSFRKPLSRCPGSSVGQWALPVIGSFFQ
jgi:hypothetical protein